MGGATGPDCGEGGSGGGVAVEAENERGGATVAAANHAKHQADRAAKQRSPLKPGKKNSPVKKKK